MGLSYNERVAPYKTRAVVGKDGVVSVKVEGLAEGACVEVEVLESSPRLSLDQLTEMVEKYHRENPGKTRSMEEIDAAVRAERDSWDS